MFILINKLIHNRQNNGVIALPAILLISAIILQIVAAGALIAFSFSRGSASVLASTTALLGATVGIDDAMQRIIRNSYNNSYSIITNISGREVVVNIVIERDPPDLPFCNIPWGCRYRVRSTGQIFFRMKRVEAIFTVDQNNRDIRRLSFREIEI